MVLEDRPSSGHCECFQDHDGSNSDHDQRVDHRQPEKKKKKVWDDYQPWQFLFRVFFIGIIDRSPSSSGSVLDSRQQGGMLMEHELFTELSAFAGLVLLTMILVFHWSLGLLGVSSWTALAPFPRPQ